MELFSSDYLANIPSYSRKNVKVIVVRIFWAIAEEPTSYVEGKASFAEEPTSYVEGSRGQG